MESPNSDVLESPLIWQITSEHMASFRNYGAKESGVCARWHRKRVSDDSNHFITTGTTSDVLVTG